MKALRKKCFFYQNYYFGDDVMIPDLPTKALNFNIALLQLAEKLNERELPFAAKYILKHGVRASDYVHRSRRNTSKYKCITNFRMAIYEIDKTMCLITHLYNRNVITEEEYKYIKSKSNHVRSLTFMEILYYSQVADWYEFNDDYNFVK